MGRWHFSWVLLYYRGGVLLLVPGEGVEGQPAGGWGRGLWEGNAVPTIPAAPAPAGPWRGTAFLRDQARAANAPAHTPLLEARGWGRGLCPSSVDLVMEGGGTALRVREAPADRRQDSGSSSPSSSSCGANSLLGPLSRPPSLSWSLFNQPGAAPQTHTSPLNLRAVLLIQPHIPHLVSPCSVLRARFTYHHPPPEAGPDSACHRRLSVGGAHGVETGPLWAL